MWRFICKYVKILLKCVTNQAWHKSFLRSRFKVLSRAFYSSPKWEIFSAARTECVYFYWKLSSKKWILIFFHCLSVSCIRSHYWTPLCILDWSQIESKLPYNPYLYNTRGSSWTLYCPRATDINFLQTKQSKETVNLWESIKWSSKRNVWIFYQNFLTNCFRKCIEIHLLENL